MPPDFAVSSIVDRSVELAREVYNRSTWDTGSAEALLVDDGICVYIAFRGSEGLGDMDWIRNFRAMPWPRRGLGFVHRGFLKGAERMLEVSFDEIHKLSHEGRKIVVCGHSKGGGEAVIFAALLALKGHRPFMVVTFGAPRAGFSKLGDVLAGVKVLQYWHGADIVPHLPPAGFILRYRHVGEINPIGRPRNRLEDHDIRYYYQWIKTH